LPNIMAFVITPEEKRVLDLIKGFDGYDVNRLMWQMAIQHDLLFAKVWQKEEWDDGSGVKLSDLQDSLDFFMLKGGSESLLIDAHNGVKEVVAERCCSECGKEDAGEVERFYTYAFGQVWICGDCNEPYRQARLKREAEESKAAAPAAEGGGAAPAPATSDGEDEFPNIVKPKGKKRKD
jgi:hypothetical protein